MGDLRQISLRHQSLLNGLGTACLSKAGLAEGTNAATIKTAAPNGAGTDYCIDGVAYHKADTDNIAVTAGTAQPVSSTAWYLVCLNAAGTVSVVQGLDSTASKVAGRELPGEIPFAPSGVCAIGAFKIVTDGVTTFTPGTTDIGAAGITETFYDFVQIPSAGGSGL